MGSSAPWTAGMAVLVWPWYSPHEQGETGTQVQSPRFASGLRDPQHCGKECKHGKAVQALEFRSADYILFFVDLCVYVQVARLALPARCALQFHVSTLRRFGQSGFQTSGQGK